MKKNHTSRTCQKPGPSHNPSVIQSNMMGGATTGLHKTILPSVSGRAPPPLHQHRAPTPAMLQQLLPPVTFTPMLAGMHPVMPMMPTMTYQAINYMGQQFGPPTPAVAPPAPAPAPPVGMMMHYYTLCQQPPPLLIVGVKLQYK